MKKKKTLVLGASTNPSRYSNIAIHRLTAAGHPVVAVGRKRGNVDAVSISEEPQAFDDLDTVTLYLNPVHQKEYYEYLVSLKPNRVIFNPGTENSELYSILQKEHIQFEVACTLVLLSTNQY